MSEDKDRIVMGHIYVLLFPNRKRYVGQTITSIANRIWQHWHPPKKERNFPVHRAMQKYGKKYGEDSVKIEKTLTLKCTQEYLDLIEDRAIIAFNTLMPNGYNLKRGGSYGAHSEKSKAKMSAARKGKPGRPQSEETKAKLRGRHHSEEAKAKISLNSARKGKPGTMLGRQLSEEHKVKISISSKGKPKPWLKGRYLSEETIAKRTASRRGWKHSEETKVKISETKKGKKHGR